MCDEWTEGELDRAGVGVSRRGFAVTIGAGALAAALPVSAGTRRIVSRDVSFATKAGTADAYFVHPARGRHPAVLVWPDIRGLRPAFRQMADRLAGEGYAVLVINPFYRDAKAPVVTPTDDFADPKVRERLFGYAGKLTMAAAGEDAVAALAFLDTQKAVDRKRKLGVTGYCLGGPLTIASAVAAPDRFAACSSFHGSRQSNDTPQSPHLQIAATKASYLFALAEDDDQRDPREKDRLKAALAGRPGFNEVEVYAGARHGWTVPDGRAYDAAAADKAWARMRALFKAAL